MDDSFLKKKYWKGKNVFVTGGMGFIGSWLLKYLIENQANVTCLNFRKDKNVSEIFEMRKCNIVEGRIEDIELLNKIIVSENIDHIFHLAGQPIVQGGLENPLETIEINVMGTTKLLEACRLNSSKLKSIVICSSINAYGNSNNLPFNEDSSLNGVYPYDVSKSCMDIIAQSYGKTYGLPIGITRFSNVYGGGDLNFNRLVPSSIKKIFENEKIIARQNGEILRSFLYVKDVVHGLLTLGEKIPQLNLIGEAFNFSMTEPKKIIEVINILVKISGKNYDSIVLSNETGKEISHQYSDSKKANKILKWIPQYSLEEGIKETISWYEEYFKK
jgi:CDP-glucose 4,6-dehydratase